MPARLSSHADGCTSSLSDSGAPAGMRVRRWLTSALPLLLGWVERSRQRRQLGTLNDRLLKDMGVTRQQIERELAKPFWRP